MPYVPERGDWVRLNFDPQAGHEQAGKRPGLVLSTLRFNQASGLCLVCPVTRTRRGWRTEVEIPAGQPVSGCVLTGHVRSVDFRARGIEYIGSAAPGVVEQAADIGVSLLDPA